MQQIFFQLFIGFFGLKIDRFLAEFAQIMGFFVTEIFINFFPKFLNKKIGTFCTLEKPEKSLKPDTKKPGPPEARYIKARARPKPEKSRPDPSLTFWQLFVYMFYAIWLEATFINHKITFHGEKR